MGDTIKAGFAIDLTREGCLSFCLWKADAFGVLDEKETKSKHLNSRFNQTRESSSLYKYSSSLYLVVTLIDYMYSDQV